MYNKIVLVYNAKIKQTESRKLTILAQEKGRETFA